MTRRLAWLVVLVAAVAIAAVLRSGEAPIPALHQDLVDVSDPADPRPDAPDTAPNVVLVVGCTVRKDQTSLHGGPPATTPFLASLAAEGLLLEDLITAAPWTRAASTAIVSGHHPVAIGMADPSAGRDERVLPDRITTLAEHLRAQGYTTLGLTTNPNLNDVYGFHQGFDRYRELARLWREKGVKMPGAIAVEQALALVDEREVGRPFFLQLVLVDAHAPFRGSEAELAVHADPALPAEVVAYRAVLRRLDEAVATLDRGLRDRGFGPEDTLFVFVNDHGEGLGWPEHHGASHGRFLAPSSVGGVFVARGPGVPRAVLPGPASQIDVPSTITGLAGLPPFPGAGVDLSARLAGGDTGQDHVFTDTWFKSANRAAVYGRTRACQLDFGGEALPSGCFERAQDPLHARPFPDEALEAVLRGWRAERLAEAAALGAAPIATPSKGVDEQLKALGYVE